MPVASAVRRMMTRATSFTALLTIALAAVAMAAPAQGAERATLTWDTDQTDIDLHVWDSNGEHAWYGARDDIPEAELSTDIIYGFGPEHFEEFTGSEGRTYTYGVCYYGSNTDDGTVPETVATVEIVDPNGQRRTLKRTLSAAKQAYYLGSSPEGPGYEPGDDWCSTGPYRPATETGPPPDTGTGGGGAFEGCPRVRRRIGVVELCANQFTGGGPVYTASGNVRVNGSVYLGEGPVLVDVGTRKISATTSSIAVMRGAQAFPVAGGGLVIDANAVTDPVSGRDQLAAISLSSARPDLQALKLAGLPLSVTGLTGGSMKLYLDRREGGGVITQAGVTLPFAGGQQSAGSLAVGVHGASATPVRALGGSASFGNVVLPGAWGFTGFTLTYNEAGNTWRASGGLQTPYFGLDLSGGLADGQLDEVGVSVARDVPIGATGFIMTKVGGRVAGLSRPPLRIQASVSAKWGSVPGAANALLLLNDVTLDVDLSGKASLKGNITFLSNPSPVKGTIAINFAISPFRASGRLSANAELGPLEVNAGGGVVVRTNAFTAAGNADGKVRGVTIASARGVVSDKGVGVTGRFCFWRACTDLGAGMNWKDFPDVRYIGADVDQFVTASSVAASAAATRRSIVVKPGRPFLFVDADGADGTQPAFRLRSPNGRTYTTGIPKADSRILKDRALGFTALTIANPRPGRWTVTPTGTAKGTRFVGQAVRRTKRVRVARVSPRGSRAKALSRRSGAAIKVGWTSRGLPPTAKVNVYVTPNPGQLGQFVTGGKRARSGLVRISRKLLRKGVNRIRLVVVDNGVAVDDVIARQVIRAK